MICVPLTVKSKAATSAVLSVTAQLRRDTKGFCDNSYPPPQKELLKSVIRMLKCSSGRGVGGEGLGFIPRQATKTLTTL